MRHILIAVALLAVAASARAQDERIGSSTPTLDYQPGWTFTPTVGVAETFDDNITLFGIGTADNLNNDYITSVFPSADLHYEGKHTHFNVDYGGNYLGYRTFNALDRWDQNGSFDLRREETAHVKWFAHANGVTMPETDLIEFGAIPYRHTGATMVSGATGFEYLLSARDSVSVTSGYQSFHFQRSDLGPSYLRGGDIFDESAQWRHRPSEHLAFGADYEFRRAMVVGDAEQFNLHSVEAAADYDLSETWSTSVAAGVVYMQPTPTLPARTGPAYSVGITRHRATNSFRVAYINSYLPAFGFGGVIKNQEINGSLHLEIAHRPHLYTEQTAMFRNDTPLVATTLQLPLRSFIAYSVFGWEPDRWVRIEAFYVRVNQTSLQPGGVIYRDRVGIQIVTSKPMRMQ